MPLKILSGDECYWADEYLHVGHAPSGGLNVAVSPSIGFHFSGIEAHPGWAQ
jgi:hypothetical protein